MSLDNLTLRTAKKHVRNYGRESQDLMAHHREAMDCRDCEAFLQLGIEAFNWIMRADRSFRRGISDGSVQYDEQAENCLHNLCMAWLGPCRYAESWVKIQLDRGYTPDNLATFRDYCEEMRAIVHANERTGDEQLPEALEELRGQALIEHANGETAEFV